jgi:hypothetical protein
MCCPVTGGAPLFRTLPVFSLPGRVWKRLIKIARGEWKQELRFEDYNVSSTISRSAHLFDSCFSTMHCHA